MTTDMHLKSIIIAVGLFFVTLSSTAQKKYRIVSIDSTENYYFVEARRCFKSNLIIIKKTNYISPKEGIEKIKKGQRYMLELEPYRTAKFTPDTESYSISIEGKIVWNSNKRYNLFSSPSISNLFYIDTVVDD